ncbi:MAG TPA: O-antigen ligase family protein [Bacteroidales bacterium]|nr:O-antigen ligase family protein [Bacteroidales bacterium]
MTEQSKTAWVYLGTAIYLAISLYLMVSKDIWYFFALPLVLGVLLLYIYSLDKVLLLISFITPLSLNIENMDAGLAISLPAEPMLFGVLVLYLAKLLYEGHYDRRATAHPISLIIFLMLFWMLITTFTSEMPLVSAKAIVARLWFIVPSYFLAIQVFRKIKNIHWFIWLYNIALIIVIGYTIYRHWTFGFSDKSAHWVMSPLYNDHTAYGAALALFLILTIGYIFYPGLSHTRRFWVVSMAILLAVATLLSLSRAAWISLAVSAGVFAAVWLRIKFRYILAGFVIIIAFLISFQHQIIDTLEKNKQDSSADFVEHVQSIYNISSDASNLERINRWQAALRLFNERPLFGWGPGTYQFVYGPYQRSKEKTIISTNAGDGGNAHSEYIGPLSEMGLPGMLIVFLLVGTMIYQGLRTYKQSKNKQARVLSLSATLALISYFTHGLLNNFLDTDKLSVPVWGCMAIIVAVELYYKNLEPDNELLQSTSDRIAS